MDGKERCQESELTNTSCCGCDGSVYQYLGYGYGTLADLHLDKICKNEYRSKTGGTIALECVSLLLLTGSKCFVFFPNGIEN